MSIGSALPPWGDQRRAYWRGRRVFLTGSTGFKGSWLALWLSQLGADVKGYALKPLEGAHFEAAELGDVFETTIGDVRDSAAVGAALRAARPEIVFHLAAQPLVLESYRNPIDTFDVNVMGTARLLEELRNIESVRAIVVVTSDKCYDVRGDDVAYRESDPMGGKDPYSASKGATELVVASYRASFFPDGPALVSVRAGNVIGGGDRAAQRLIPDAVKALERREALEIRHPEAVRPWQYVLDPLSGYLDVAERAASGQQVPPSVNFGPGHHGERTVRWILERFRELSAGKLQWRVVGAAEPETRTLRLDVRLAESALGWVPSMSIEASLEATYQWYFDPGVPRAKSLGALQDFESRIARIRSVADVGCGS